MKLTAKFLLSAVICLLFSQVSSAQVSSVYKSGFAANAMVFDASDNLYVADVNTGVVSKIPSGGGTPVTYATITGASPTALSGMTFDNSGNLYVSDQSNNHILKIPSGGGSFSHFVYVPQYNRNS